MSAEVVWGSWWTVAQGRTHGDAGLSAEVGLEPDRHHAVVLKLRCAPVQVSN